jgi:putative tryptophan/tyrosine transport system substrate-binding protein
VNCRRKFLAVLVAGAVVLPLRSFAQQQGKVWRVGFLALRRLAILESDYSYGPFRQGMRELGYVDGKNLVIEWRSADSKVERLPGLAAELVKMKVDIIVVAGGQAAGAAQKATATIPIVIVSVGDPVVTGLVKSYARPGGNITGVANLNVDLGPKRLEMLLSMVPKLSRVAVLVNPSNPSNMKALDGTLAEGKKRGVTILRAEARTPQEIETAFALMARDNAGAVIVVPDALFSQNVQQVGDLAAKYRLPSIAAYLFYAEAGLLMTYGTNASDLSRRAATYVDKIFKGANPGDLPIEQPTKFEFIINRKTAKALGLPIPQSLLVSADRVLE